MISPVKLGATFLAGSLPFLTQGCNEVKAPTCTPKVRKLEEVPKANSPKDFYLFTHDKAKQKIKMELASEKAIEEYYKRNKLDTFKDHIDQLRFNVYLYNLSTAHLKNHVILELGDKRCEVIPKGKNVSLGWSSKLDEFEPRGFSTIQSEPIMDPPGWIIDRLPPRKYVDLDSLAIRKYDGKDVLSLKMKVDIFDETGKVIPAAEDKVFVLPLDFNLVITKGDTAYIVPHKIKEGVYDVKFDPSDRTKH